MANERTVDDGTVDWSLGQDAWHSPHAIRDNQYFAGVNLSTRGGYLRPRAPFHQQVLDFEDRTIRTSFGRDRQISDIWRDGKFQALIPLFLTPDHYLITVVCGLIFRTNIRTLKTILLSEDIRVNQYSSRVNWSFANEYIVLFDFPDYPVLIKDIEVTRSDIHHLVNGEPQPQVPVSVIGTYNENRLFIANDGVELTAGDAVGNLFTPEAPVTFTEVLTTSSPFFHQFFSLPSADSIYPITAMGFIQELDASTGIGQMFVSSKNKIYFYKTNQPREQWTSEQFAGVLLANIGIPGQRAFVNVNSDVVFISVEGQVHAFSTARNEARKWGNVPISREVKNYLISRPELRYLSVLGYFDNRIFISANPYRVQALNLSEEPITDYAHGGFVILELENMTTLLQEGAPVWSGLWTGIDPMDITNIGDRCFVMAKDGANGVGGNSLYELKQNSTWDMIGGRKRRIRSIIYTREYDFKRPMDLKSDQSLMMYVQDLRGQVDLKIERKPSHGMAFLTWANWSYEAPAEICVVPSDEMLNGFAAHRLRELIFGDPEIDGCNPINDDSYTMFRSIQFRITIEGDDWRLHNFKMRATLIPLEERAGDNTCEPLPAVAIPEQCVPDWKIPEETLCP